MSQMGRRFVILLYSFILLNFATIAYAKSLDLYAYLQLAKENHLGFKIIEHQRNSQEHLLDLKKSDGSLNLSLIPKVENSTLDSIRTNHLTSRLVKNNPNIGNQVSLEVSHQETKDTLMQMMSVQSKHSLLKNFGGRLYAKEIQNIMKEKEINQLFLAEEYENLLHNHIQKYLDWKLTYIQYQTAKKIYDNSLTLQDHIKKRQEQSIATQLDVDKSLIHTLNAKDTFREKETNFKKHSAFLAAQVGIKEQDTPKLQDFAQNKKIDLQKTLDFINKKSRFKRLADLQFNLLASKVTLMREQMRSDFSLLLEASSQHTRNATKTSNDQKIAVGLEWSMKLYDDKGWAQIVDQKVKQQKQQFESDRNKQDAVAQIHSLYKKIHLKKKRLLIKEKKYSLAKKIAAKEKKRYQNGLVTLESYLDAQKNEDQYQLNVLEAKIACEKLYAEWQSLSDQLHQDTGN